MKILEVVIEIQLIIYYWMKQNIKRKVLKNWKKKHK
jgi:hypothetical protein